MKYNWRELDKMQVSPCCGAKMIIREVGVSQMSYELKFTCSKCKNKLNK